MSSAAGRAVPFHCPYCGETDLWPHEAADGSSPHGSWECRACLRAFSVKMLGQLRGLGSARPPEDQLRPGGAS